MTINRHTMGEAKLLYADSKEIVPAHEYDAIVADLAETKRALAVVQDTSIAHAGNQSDLLERTLKEGYDIQARPRDRIRELEARIEYLRTVANTNGVRSEDMASAIYRVLSSSPMETKAQPPLPSGCNPPGLYETHTIGGPTSDRASKP